MVVTPFAIGSHVIGAGGCCVIAEAGVNHNGDPAIAHRLIDTAADAGADAIKFQLFDPARLVSATAATAAYQQARGGAAFQRELLAQLVLPAAQFPGLASHARDRGLAFIATPFDEESVAALDRLEMSALKIGSGDLTHAPLIAAVAATGRPILLSTGMGTLEEVREAVAVVDRPGNSRLALLHCVSSYPAPAADCNLRAIDTLRETFHVPVGWSDHTDDVAIGLAAIARGADLIEKHLTLDRGMPGPDHAASLEPHELRHLVRGTRAVLSALGDGVKRAAPSEQANRAVVRRSVHLRHACPGGHRLLAADLIGLRPEGGFAPAAIASLVGRRLRAARPAGHQLVDEDLETWAP